MRAPRSILLALALGTATALAGCGSSSHTSTNTVATATQTGDTVQIVMKSLAFNPPRIHATVGQRVVWENADNVPHTVTYVSGPRFRSSNTVNSGHRYEITLTTPGTIHYYCMIHPWMTAAIVVTP